MRINHRKSESKSFIEFLVLVKMTELGVLMLKDKNLEHKIILFALKGT